MARTKRFSKNSKENSQPYKGRSKNKKEEVKKQAKAKPKPQPKPGTTSLVKKKKKFVKGKPRSSRSEQK